MVHLRDSEPKSDLHGKNFGTGRLFCVAFSLTCCMQ